MSGSRRVWPAVLAALIGCVVVYFALAAILHLVFELAIVAVVVLAIGAGIRYAMRHRAVGKAEAPKSVKASTSSGLTVGDTVIANEGFQGPLELAFSVGRVVEMGRGKAQVRFNDDPSNVYTVDPGELTRIG